MNKLKEYFKWFMRPTIKTSFPSNMDSIKKLKKKVKNLEKQIKNLVFKIEGLENELMIIMKEHRHLINVLESRVDTLNEDCEKCTKS